ncbi:MAG: GyrI-like domain-containing protein [Methanothrix sp.]|nr:GyrI-like domain-containing protein [Methanothrix sp.]HOU70759.1 GyrI-like domain-containing protein [Methanothrix sp.]HUM81802.1 GyrI-like domain-containing protein [Methanothrix sp.]
MTEIALVNEKPQLVAGMRRKGHYKEIAEMLPNLFEYAMSHNAVISGPPLYLMHEMNAEEARRADEAGSADIEVCVAIAERIPESEEVKCYEICGGKMARTVHKGPYHDCPRTYEVLLSWLEENGHKIAGPMREAYINDPREVAPEDILTIIYVPIS